MEKIEKKVSKKKLALWLLPLLAIGMVFAGVAYYQMFVVNVNVHQPISVTGDLEQSIDCDAGETCYGSEVTISNDGDNERTITVSDNNENDEVTTFYVGEIQLTEKTVVFGESPWAIPSDAEKATVRFTVIGDEFSAEVTEGAIDGYELIYYADNSERFSNPANAILITDVSGNLPYSTDGNAEEIDYSDEYSTAHGAKLWYVSSSAINEDGSVDWSQASSFLYETFLIQYNSDGQLVVYPNSEITIIPAVSVDKYAADGTTTFDVTVA